MKYVFIVLIIFSFDIKVQAQCGTWQPLPEQVIDWTTVDTLGAKISKDTARKWVYDKELLMADITYASYQPCGSGEPIVYKQYRICSLTGIRQVRKRIFAVKYIPPILSEYERVVDSLISRITFGGGLLLTPDSMVIYTGKYYLWDTTIWMRIPTKTPKKKP